MRTTVILHAFKGKAVTWLTDESAYPLLKGNPLIDRVLFYNLTTILQLESEHFDTVVNLEKVPGICALAGKIHAWQHYGFRFDPMNGEPRGYREAIGVFDVYADIGNKRQARRAWQNVLYEMIGQVWGGEKYVLGYEHEQETTYDVGLNYRIGKKWPSKAWERWDDLYNRLRSNKIKVSLQQGCDSLTDYMHWIGSCKTIVTHDSLGLHLALAMGKRVIGLFGPTAAHEIEFYGQGEAITPSGDYDCAPCFLPVCPKPVSCINTITVEEVLSRING